MTRPDTTESASPSADPETDFRTPLRTGGWVGLAGETVYIARGDERIQLQTTDVLEVTHEDYDAFIAVLSAVLVGFGVWFVRESPLSLLFSVAGLVSLYLVYRQRHEVTIRLTSRAKPLTLYPEEPGELLVRLAADPDGAV